MKENIAIQLVNLSKRYTLGSKKELSLRETLTSFFSTKSSTYEFEALHNINLSIQKGESVGIIGHNGAGKSTLFKILSKITYPTSGKAIIYGRLTSLLEVGTGFHQELTGRENIYLNGSLLGMSKREIQDKMPEIIEFAGVRMFIDSPLKKYSTGMAVRLAFSIAAHLHSDIFLLDEVLSVGDIDFQNKCIEKIYSLKNKGSTILLVSHHVTTIKKICDRTIILKNGKIVADGDTKTVLSTYVQPNSIESKTYVDNPYVKRVQLLKEKKTSLLLEYDLQKSGFFPHFGFIIYNQLGIPIFGGNPTTEGLKIPKVPNPKGIIEVTIDQPTLTDGNYTVSIWFGNETEELFVDHDCLRFCVTNIRPSKLGFIKPDLTFKYL